MAKIDLRNRSILVGIFWTRVGTPTGEALSGSIEEIEKHHGQGKPAMLYFSNVPVALDSVDQDQYRQLTEFKKWAKDKGLIESFGDRNDFRDQFRRHLPLALQNNPYLKSVLERNGNTDLEGTVLAERENGALSADALEVLKAAASDAQGMVMILQSMEGTSIRVGEREFGDSRNRRSVVRWEAAVSELKRVLP